MKLTLRDAEKIFDAVDNPPPPNDRLIEAAQAYKKEFGDAKDQGAKEYYLNFGFIPLSDHSLKLFLPLSTLLQMHSSV